MTSPTDIDSGARRAASALEIAAASVSPHELAELRLSRDLVDAAPALTWHSRPDGSGDWFSASWLRHTGRTMSESLGDGWQRDVHPEDIERCVGIRATSAEAQSPFTLDYRLHHHSGGYRWMLDQAVPRFDAEGHLSGYVGSSVDIHDRHDLEEKLADRTQALRLAERRQATFLSVLSHELRNPLAPIANAASVLRTMEASNPILLRLREILERQVTRLSRLVEDLIEVTRSARGQISLVSERVAIDGVVQAAISLCQEKINLGRHFVDLKSPAARLFVKGDPTRLAQALGHIIGNAAKFSIEPGLITIEVSAMAGTVYIAVHDDGRGIGSEFMPHAFELFAQEDQTLARTLGGLGVGLTLAKRIGQLHGGDVEGHSEGPGLGSTFVMSLPLLDVQMADAENPAQGTEDDRAPLAERYRVLVVEDIADPGERVALQMEMWGNEVLSTRHPTEALRMASSFRPQIVLCDLGLAGTDALDLVAPLRARTGDPAVLFVAVTGHARTDDQERARAAGFDAFLVKPLHADDVARLMRAYPRAAG